MNKCLVAAAAVIVAATLGACQQKTAQQMNKANAKSKLYIGALSCNVSGSTGYVFGSTKDLDCVFLTTKGTSERYTGKINKFGIDLGYTKAIHTVWHVYTLGSDRGAGALAGNYGGEDSTVALGDQVGGNWLYGGKDNEIVLAATGEQGNAGYNFAYGIAEISLAPRR
jgi:hypothetical protein